MHCSGWVYTEQNGVLLNDCSILCIKEELGQLSLQSSSPKEEPPPEETCDGNSHDDCNKQSPPSPGVSVDYQNPTATQHAGWIDGLLGCLRPVWTIIGKAAANEIKGRQGDYFWQANTCYATFSCHDNIMYV
jgi:hypothetical protein